MCGALKKFFRGAESDLASSKSRAKNRLQFVLVQDRASLSNEQMLSFKKELVEVIERYFVIDKERFDIDYRRSSDTTTLLINSPVLIRKPEQAAAKKSAA